MAFRPAGVNDGSRPTPKIPTTASIAAGYGDDPAKLPSSVIFSFAPRSRAKVDEAVAAFVSVLEEDDE